MLTNSCLVCTKSEFMSIDVCLPTIFMNTIIKHQNYVQTHVTTVQPHVEAH